MTSQMFADFKRYQDVQLLQDVDGVVLGVGHDQVLIAVLPDGSDAPKVAERVQELPSFQA